MKGLYFLLVLALLRSGIAQAQQIFPKGEKNLNPNMVGTASKTNNLQTFVSKR